MRVGMCGAQAKPRWSEKEITLLQETYGVVPYEQLYDYFNNRSKKSIQIQASRLGLS
jgi:hypothetical protein